MRVFQAPAGLLLLGLSVCAGLGNEDRHGSAKITFGSGVDDLTPTDINIWFYTSTMTGDDGMETIAVSDRIEVHLPYFGGGYNSFGLQSADSTCMYPMLHTGGTTSCGSTVPSTFFEAYDTSGNLVGNGGFARAVEWDARREILKIQIVNSNLDGHAVQKIVVKTAALIHPYADSSMPNGLGPLPPRGGIDEDWYLKAYVKHYTSSYCDGGTTTTRLGHLDECGGTSSTRRLVAADDSQYAMSATTFNSGGGRIYVFPEANVQQFQTEHPVMPSQLIGATGTMQKGTFTWAKAEGDSDGPGRENCITVSFITNVALTSSTSRPTTISLTGLSNSQTASKGDEFGVWLDDDCEVTNSGQAGQAFFGQTSTTSSASISDWDVAWDQDEGKLTMKMANGYHIEAGELFIFSFLLTNPTEFQPAQDLMISAEGPACLSRNLCQASEVSQSDIVNISPTDFVSNTRVLESRKPYFRSALFFQSSDDPDTSTTIFVTLRPNIDITPTNDDEEITVTGLCGTLATASKITLLNNDDGSTLDSFTDATRGDANSNNLAIVNTQADWNKESGELKITIIRAMRGNRRYAFSFKWKTVNEESDACDLKIKSPNPGFDEHDAENVGNTVGKVNSPSFTEYKIGQVTTRPEAINLLCVTLRANDKFETKGAGENDESKFTITGLTGTKAQSASGADIYICPTDASAISTWTASGNTNKISDATTVNGGAKAVLARDLFGSDPAASAADNKFVFDADEGHAILRIHSSTKSIEAGSANEIVFALPFENDKLDRECSEVRLIASGGWSQDVEMEQSETGRALQDSIADGDSCPLRVYEPQFLVRTIAQSTPLAGEVNTITVSLRPNMHLFSLDQEGSAVITISGLTQTDSSDGAVSTTSVVTGTYGVGFTGTGADIDWVGSTGTLTLTLAQTTLATCTGTTPVLSTANTCMQAGVTYVFSFQVTNPDSEQSAPDISVGGINEDGDVLEMLKFNPPVVGALTALRIVPDYAIMRDYDVGQLSAAPGARNAICVTFRPWKTISGVSSSSGGASASNSGSGQGRQFDTLTISGLIDYQTSNQDLVVYQTSGVEYTATCNFMADDDESNNGCGRATSTATIANKVTYNSVDDQITMKINSMNAGTKYTGCFLLTNPKIPTSCPDLTMTLNTDDGTQVETMEQDTSGKLQYYPVGSTCAGFVSEKKFLTKVLRSSSNVTQDAINKDTTDVYMIADLWPNYKIEAGDIVQISGLDGYSKAGADNDISVRFHKNGIENLLTFDDEGTFADGTLSLTVMAGMTVSAEDDYQFWETQQTGLAAGTVDPFGTDKEFWEVTFLLDNSATEQDARNIEISVGTASQPDADFPKASMTTGHDDEPELRHRKKAIFADQAKVRRQGDCESVVSDLEIEFTAPVNMYGGETILIDLPHATMPGEGYQSLYGITATIGDTDDAVDAFETYASFTEANEFGRSNDQAAAVFYEGYVGASDERTGETGKYLDGFVRLHSDDDGYEENKIGWQVDTEALMGLNFTIKRYANFSSFESGVGYNNVNLVSYSLFYNNFDLNYTSVTRIFGDDDEQYLQRLFGGKEDSMAGLYLVCGNEVRMILHSANYTLGVDAAFSSLTEANEATGAGTSCYIKHKQAIGKYTGMTGMIGETRVTFIQGGGELYTVMDGSGTAPSYVNLEKKQYTVYSRLEITTANGESVQKGTTLKIKIPKSSGITIPCDQDTYVTGDTTNDKHTIAEQTKMAVMFFATIAGSRPSPNGPLTNISVPGETLYSTVDLSEFRPNIGKYSYGTDIKNQVANKQVLFFGALHYAGKATLSEEEDADGSIYTSNLDTFYTNYFQSVLPGVQTPTLTGSLANAPVVYGETTATDYISTTSTTSESPRIAMRVMTGSTHSTINGTISVPQGITDADNGGATANEGIEPARLIGYPYVGVTGNGSWFRIKSGATLYNWGMVGEMLGVNTVPDNEWSSYVDGNANVRKDMDSAREAFAFSQPALISSVAVPTTTVGPSFNLQQMRLTIEDKAIRQRLSSNIRTGIILQDFFTFPLGSQSSGPAPEVTETFEFADFPGQVYSATGPGDFSLGPAPGETAAKYEGCEGACDVRSLLSSGSRRQDTSFLAGSPAIIADADPVLDLTFPISYQTDADAVLAILTARRRLLAAPDGYEYRIVDVNNPDSTCNCPASSTTSATCPDRTDGTYQVILLSSEVCAVTTTPESGGGDNTGAIVGGVVGGIAGLLILGALAYFCCKTPAEPEQPWAKPTPAVAAATQQMVPVYLPEQYPELGGSAYPQAPATFDAAPYPPMAPMGMSAQPMAPPVGMSAPVMQPTLYQSQDPGMMYSSQQPGMYAAQPVMYASQQPYGAYGM